MGFLSFLGDALDFLPLPGAGVVGDVLKGIGDTSSVLGGQQAAKAKGAATQADIQDAHDRNAIAAYQAQQAAQNQAAQTDLERKQFGLESRGTNAKDALIGALLGGKMQATVPGAAIQSGLLKSLNSNPAALAAMSDLGTQAKTGLDTPDSFTGGNLVTPPTLTPLPNVGTAGADAANIGQLIASGGSSFMDILKKIQDASNAKKGGGAETYGSSDPASGYGGGF